MGVYFYGNYKCFHLIGNICWEEPKYIPYCIYIKVIATASSNEERGILENLDTPIGKIGSLGIKKDKRIFMLSQTQSN